MSQGTCNVEEMSGGTVALILGCIALGCIALYYFMPNVAQEEQCITQTTEHTTEFID